MALYNLTELMNLIIDDIGMTDVPIIEKIGTDHLLERLRQSALKEFSQRCPYKKKWRFNDNEIVGGAANAKNTTQGIDYEIPKSEYYGTQLLGVTRVDPIASTGFNDIYVPSIYSYDAVSMLGSIADIKLASSMGASMSKAMTWEFILPNRIRLYNGWLAGSYEAELMLCHDDSLATIPPTAFTNFRELATLDLKAYIYNQYKRLQDLDVGIGSINLKIDDFADAYQQMRDLLKDWDDNSSLDLDYMQYF